MHSKVGPLLVLCALLHCAAAICIQPKQCQGCPSKLPYPVFRGVNTNQLANNSPYVIYTMSDINVRQLGVKAAAFTYQQLNGSYLFFYTNTLFDGSVSTNTFFIQDGPFGNGSFWFAALMGRKPYTPILANAYTMQEFQCRDINSKLYAGTTVFLAQGCTDDPFANLIIVYGTAVKPDEECLRRAENYLRTYFPKVNLVRISNTTEVFYTADIDGVPLINAENYLNSTYLKAVSYPSMEPYCSN